MRWVWIAAAAGFGIAMLVFQLTIAEQISRYGYFGAIRASSYFALLAGGSVYAWRFGGGPERTVAAMLAVAASLDPLLHLLFRLDFLRVDPTHLIISVMLLGGILVVAMKVIRLWPLWLAAVQVLIVGAHVAKAMDAQIDPVIYAVMTVLWGYISLLILIFATWQYRRAAALVSNATSLQD